jgi:hypothetical protein
MAEDDIKDGFISKSLLDRAERSEGPVVVQGVTESGLPLVLVVAAGATAGLLLEALPKIMFRTPPEGE